MSAKIRRTYKGAAVEAVLSSGGVSSATQTSITLSTSPSTWPTGKFFVVVAPGTAQEEKMCVTLSGSTLTVVDPDVTSTSASTNGRGVDDTTARTTIAGGSRVYPVATAIDFDEANELTSTYTTTGDLVYQGSMTFARLGMASATAGHVLKVNSGKTAPEWGQVATAGIGDLSVTTDKLVSSSVTTDKINNAAVTSDKLATNSVTTAKITDANVTTAKIADSNVTLGKLAAAVQELLVPTGTVSAYAGSSAPTGWLLCGGQEIAISSNGALYAVIGTTYGPLTNGSGGTGTTHFRVPDLRGRVVAGLDNMGGTTASRLTSTTITGGADALGEVGGSQTHQLTVAQMPNHDHQIIGGWQAGTGTNLPWDGSVGSRAEYGLNRTDSQGGSQAHNNVQPTMVLNYIIKA